MSSPTLSSLVAETFAAPFGKVPAVLNMTYHLTGDTLDQSEVTLEFEMLDALLKNLPFEQWEM
jgi:hypothetical protein